MLTLFDLVVRSMRKNIKLYYLYFFALIFSIGLYFIFSTLQHDPSVMKRASLNPNFASSLENAGILLIFIIIVFMVYANSIFLKRRSREIGLYQLVGLTKTGVARLLIMENVLLGIGALILGISCGALMSRLILLILMKLLSYDGFVAVTFSFKVFVQTVTVFAALIVLTSAQMLFTVYRSTLLGLFHADKQEENSKRPTAIESMSLAVLGIALIIFGYWLSGQRGLPIYLLVVLAATILGTYLLFRVTISWLFFQFRKRKNGHLGLKNSMSIAPLIHHMKANANSLTLITVLSAMTMTMIAVSYSMYYTDESNVRASNPYDVIFENHQIDAKTFSQELKKENIVFVHKSLEAIQFVGTIHEINNKLVGYSHQMLFIPAEQLLKTEANITIPEKGEAVLYDARSIDSNNDESNLPLIVKLKNSNSNETIKLVKLNKKYIVNNFRDRLQFVVSEATVRELKEKMQVSPDNKVLHMDIYQIPNKHDLAKASSIYVRHYAKYIPKKYSPDFYTVYEKKHQSSGLFIFVSGFLGLVFLLSTGSILYFKQMTEAEQEKRNYRILRQLGFDVKDIMSGIIRKQLFVFAVPLAIGILHSIFAVKAASILILVDITIPTTIAMAIYTLIYFIFAVLTIGYYRRAVKAAL